MSNIENILLEYDKKVDSYREYEETIFSLIKELLKDENIKIHNITSRLKSSKSLGNKIKLKDKYSKLSDIMDIVGIRVITFFETDIDSVSRCLKHEFKIDEANSIDKREKEYDRFGYLSLHYVFKLSNSRNQLKEYQKFKDFKFEIQIRSILQHAWAEIEHDLGYKNEIGIPNKFKRDFSRISALLEVADLEFSRLKSSLENYQETIDEKVSSHPEIIDLNQLSFKSFVYNSSLLLSADKLLCKKTNHQLVMDEYDISENYLKEFDFLGIESIKQLELALDKHKFEIPIFAGIISGIANAYEEASYTRGASIYYLNYILVLKKNNPKALTTFVKKFKYLPEEKLESFTKNLTESYKKINLSL